MNRKRMTSLPGALLTVVLLSSTAQATVHLINVGNFMFTPRHTTITLGDTLRWVWVNGTHTATSGDTTACAGDGIFSGPLDNTHHTYQYFFTTIGDYPFFCMFHCSMGMHGLITVLPNPNAVPEPRPLVAGTAPRLLIFPNPFFTRAGIELRLARAEPVRVEVHDVSGRAIALVADRDFAAGTSTLTWDGRTDAGAAAAGGIYYATAVAKSGRETARLILVR
jgi:plastocyanin